MSELIDRRAFIEQERKLYCEDCDRRKGTKNGKPNVICYKIGEAPCRACWLDDALTDLEDFPAVSPWHRVEEDSPDGNEDAVIYYEWTGISGRVYRETSIISLNELIVLGRRPIAWIEKPEPQKEENDDGFVALSIKETERSEE